MTAPVHITDGDGSRNKAKVTSNNQLVTAPFDYDDVEFRELDVIDTAFNFFVPKLAHQFVITAIRLKADRSVSVTDDASVVIYEAGAVDSTTVSKIIFQDALIRGESVTLLPLNLLVSEGVFLNATTTDENVFMSIMGYYLPVAR